MVDKVEMSLDDIIKQSKPSRGGIGRKFGQGRGGGGRGPPRVAGGGIGGPRGRRNSGNARPFYSRASGDIDGRWQHDMYDGVVPRGRGNTVVGGGQAKLLVSNLDFGVSDSDVTELFSEFGTLKSAAIHYERSGRSLGVADVVFERRADAVRAMKRYNGVPLDGRPMKIKFADDVAAAAGLGGGAGGLRASGRLQMRSPPSRQGGARPRGRGAPRGGGGRRGGPGGPKRPATLEELDAELDAWKSTQ